METITELSFAPIQLASRKNMPEETFVEDFPSIYDKNEREIRNGDFVTIRLSTDSRIKSRMGDSARELIYCDGKKFQINGLASNQQVKLKNVPEWLNAIEVEL
jgi:hypothetical protein